MILNIVIFIIILYFLTVGYVKLNYPFWSRQPVFYIFNIRDWIFPRGIIVENIQKNRFYDEEIKLFTFDQFTSSEKDEILHFVTKNYNLYSSFLQNHIKDEKNENYTKRQRQVLSEISNHLSNVFFSQKKFEKTILGLLVSIPLNVKLDTTKFNLNYYKYNIVNEKHKKKNYDKYLMYNTQFNINETNYKNTYSSGVFKTNKKIDVVVPFTTFNGFLFNNYNWKPCYTFDVPNLNIIFIDNSNLNIFYDIFHHSCENFSYYFTPNFTNISNMVEKYNWKITALMIDNKLWAYYIFQNLFLDYNEDGVNKNVIKNIINYYDKTVKKEIFILGFMISLSLMSKDLKNEYFLIENVGDNTIITKSLFEKYKPVKQYENYVYLYNFSYYPKESKNVLMML